MGIDMTLLRDLCPHTLARTDFAGLGTRIEGKVRDSYVQDGRRVLVATDRVSAFDRVFGTIPLKGQVLNQTAAFWFEKTRGVAPNHLLSVPDPCVSIVRECALLPIEFVFRGYLTGSTSTSIWVRYEAGRPALLRPPPRRGPREAPEAPGAPAHADHQGAEGPARRADLEGRDREPRDPAGRALRAGRGAHGGAVPRRHRLGREPRPDPRRHEVRARPGRARASSW